MPDRVDAPLLNSWISRAAGARALLQLHSDYGSSMDAMHSGNLWNKLGRQAKHLPPSSASAISKLADSTCGLIASCSRADVVANVAHGAAQLISLDGTTIPLLFDALAEAVPRAICMRAARGISSSSEFSSGELSSPVSMNPG